MCRIWIAIPCLLFGELSTPLVAQNTGVPPAISKRQLWTTSRIVGSPDPPSRYVTEIAFPNLLLEKAVAISNAPGSDRLFVADRDGKIVSFPNDPDVTQVDIVLDIHREVYGMTFHPQFAENGFLYLFITERKPQPPRTRIARFTLKSKSPPVADADSEHIILEFPSGGHDGGCIKFGPDGFLYIGTGDGGSVNDTHLTGQYLGDLLASILRIDVDGRHSAKSYAIPPDNPFLNTPGARPEIYAYGFRQPWKFSFDRHTGDLWVGDVGQDLWEMICLVQPGGNYGWSLTEGPQAFRPERPRGPTPIIPPVIAHGHGESRSITGGFVSRGSRLPELNGAYIYADYETGKTWGLRYDGQKVTWHDELADTTLDIAGFGEDNAGELYLLTHEGGRIHRLIPRPETAEPASLFPRRLSETGIFASTKDHRPAAGIIPYSVNSPLWSDGAEKTRFLAVPDDGKIEYTPERGWKFADGAVLVKTFSLEMQRGNPESRRRLETRIMTRQSGEWAGYTYLWNDEQTDAELLGSDALEQTYTIRDETAPEGIRTQTWHFPSRAECMICHNEKGGFVLGVSTIQMNKAHDYGDRTANQIQTLNDWQLFSSPIPAPPHELASLVDPDDKSASVESRARSYLSANCAHCHRHKGGGNSNFKLMYELPLAETETVNVQPLHGTLGISEAKLLVPARPEQSLVYRRMLLSGQGRMPHIGSLEVDDAGAQLIHDWISQLSPP